jgi:hypothetical protein
VTEQASEATRPRPHFTVGEWLGQPSLNLLKQSEKTVRLRPHLIDLLVCLADRAGQVVTREEIHAIVWPGQFIAETGFHESTRWPGCNWDTHKATAGDSNAARAAYEQFLGYWKDADPDLPVLLRAREEFARLE